MLEKPRWWDLLAGLTAILLVAGCGAKAEDDDNGEEKGDDGATFEGSAGGRGGAPG